MLRRARDPGAAAPAAARGKIRLLADPRLDGVDQYGRLLRYVLRASDGINTNIALVREGAAAPYFYRGARGRFASLLQSLALRARAHHRGLWGACPNAGINFYRGVNTGTSK